MILFNMPQTINVDYMYLLQAIKEVSLLDTKSFVNNEFQWKHTTVVDPGAGGR